MTEQREVTVSSALQRHQMQQWLEAKGIAYVRSPQTSWVETTFRIVASPEQWTAINQWLEKVKA